MVMLGALFVGFSSRNSSARHLKIDTGGSMTLVGLLPPLCNDGGMLVDGGYGQRFPQPCIDWNLTVC
jgi:hypothetical protein